MARRTLIFAAIAVLLTESAIATQPVTLGQFRESYAAAARVDGETQVSLAACNSQPTLRDKAIVSYSCTAGARGSVSGLAKENGPLLDLTVTRLVGGVSDIHLFRRSVKYSVWALTRAQDGQATIAELMLQATKHPGRPAVLTKDGMRYEALLDKSLGDPTVTTWSFTAVPAK